jgi:hypothetical protein
MKLRIARAVVAFLSLALSLTPLAVAQTSAQTASALPRLVRFGGTVKDLNGNPLTGVVGITFALYSEKTGGTPLWLETQNATADSTGHYTVLLGSTKPDGLPAELFTSEQARWVGVQVSGQPEQPRVLLVSAPYALKAGDAETIGGLPPSAFVLAAPVAIGSPAGSGTAETVPPPAATDVTTTGGTLNFLPIFSGAATIIDSAVFQTGSGTTAKVGINTTTPATALDVKGSATVRGTLSLPATGVATVAAGKISQPLNLVASSFDKTSSTAVNQTFRWQAEPAANDTTSPSGTLNLLYGLGTAAPGETGLKVSSKGVVTFATGQTFPGTGDGSVTSVATGLGLKGGPITKTGTLTIDTTVVPQLAVANTFHGNQTITGNLSDTGNISATGSIRGSTASFTANNLTQVLNVTQNNTAGSADAIVATTAGGTGVSGTSTGGDGLLGVSDSYIGVWGQSNTDIGVEGVVEFSGGVAGVQGVNRATSITGLGFADAGIWGDTGISAAFGVLGTSDDGNSLFGKNNTVNHETLYAENDSGFVSGQTPVAARFAGAGASTYCYIPRDLADNGTGDLICTGTKSAAVPVTGNRMVRLYAVEAADNWFEDAGSGRLSNGGAVIRFDSTFSQTINPNVEYHIFLTPKGECEGLYVSNESADGFEVHELRGGHSNIAFDYRIMARRKGFESVRMQDVTGDFAQMKAESDALATRLAAGRQAEKARPKVHIPAPPRP